MGFLINCRAGPIAYLAESPRMTSPYWQFTSIVGHLRKLSCEFTGDFIICLLLAQHFQ